MHQLHWHHLVIFLYHCGSEKMTGEGILNRLGDIILSILGIVLGLFLVGGF
jgi:hypothetical protein